MVFKIGKFILNPLSEGATEWKFRNPASILTWISSWTQIDLSALYLRRTAGSGSICWKRCAQEGLLSSSVFLNAFLLANCHIFLTLSFGSFAWRIRIWSNWAFERDFISIRVYRQIAFGDPWLGEPFRKRYFHVICVPSHFHFLKLKYYSNQNTTYKFNSTNMTFKPYIIIWFSSQSTDKCYLYGIKILSLFYNLLLIRGKLTRAGSSR